MRLHPPALAALLLAASCGKSRDLGDGLDGAAGQATSERAGRTAARRDGPRVCPRALRSQLVVRPDELGPHCDEQSCESHPTLTDWFHVTLDPGDVTVARFEAPAGDTTRYLVRQG